MITRPKFGTYMLAALLSATSGASLAAAGWTDAGTITELNQQPATGAGATLVFMEANVGLRGARWPHRSIAAAILQTVVN